MGPCALRNKGRVKSLFSFLSIHPMMETLVAVVSRRKAGKVQEERRNLGKILGVPWSFQDFQLKIPRTGRTDESPLGLSYDYYFFIVPPSSHARRILLLLIRFPLTDKEKKH